MAAAVLNRRPTELGAAIPAHATHGISVSLPTWKDNVGYEEGHQRVVDAMKNGYPRFYVHQYIVQLSDICERKFGLVGERCFLYPTARIAERCRSYMQAHSPNPSRPLSIRIAQFVICPPDVSSNDANTSADTNASTADVCLELHIVFFPADAFALAKSFWQHTGTGISSRHAEQCLLRISAQEKGSASTTRTLQTQARPPSPVLARKGGSSGWKKQKRYMNSAQAQSGLGKEEKEEVEEGAADLSTYLEERYGRNLPISAAETAKRALRRRIAGGLLREIEGDGSREELGQVRRIRDVTEEDVYLFPTGMSAIFHAHQLALASLSPAKSVCFGFPYTDTLKILQKWGPGCHFFGHGLDSDIDDLASLLKSQRDESPDVAPILALFCEFPSNPLLRSPNLLRLRRLADEYGFLIVVDETVGNFSNVEVLPFADIVVSSLSKVFSGEVNVMGGSLVLNPQRPHYSVLKERLTGIYEDTYWAEDAVYMERNSRDYAPRVRQINYNTDIICEFLRSKSLAFLTSSGAQGDSERPVVIKEVFYPKWVTTENYDACRIGSPSQVIPYASDSDRPLRAHKNEAEGGYSGLFTVTFTSSVASEAFFDALPCEKGPSLGTNFTLACPYTILAHYYEQDWVAQYGVEAGLVRVSMGLEEEDVLKDWFGGALRAAEEAVLNLTAA